MKAHDASLDTIQCPECGHAIPVSEALSHQIAERARAQSEAEIASLRTSLKEQDERTAALVEEQVKARTAKIEQEARERARGSVSVEVEDLKTRLAETSKERDIAQKAELEARKRARELDERAKNLDLEAARTIDTERQKIEEQANKRADEQYQHKLAEKEKQIQDAKKANDELKRKLDQGSQQLQGEVSELQLEELLRSSFPMDEIEPVPKGYNGADIIQKVMSRSGRVCGTIIWESKHTKAFSEGWLQKLRDDQRKLTAEIAVLVSEVMPKDCSTFIYMNDIWVSSPQCAISLAVALRTQLANVALARAAAAGAKQKSEILYEYVVSSTQFRQRVQAMAEVFIGMEKDLGDEQRAMQRQWAKRKKQIEQVLLNTAGMYGELQALTGLPDIPALTAGTDGPEVREESAVVVQLPPRAANDRDELPF
jgi:hypothetical protein